MSARATAALARWGPPGLAVLAAGALVLAAAGAVGDRRQQALVMLALLFALWRVGGTLAGLLAPELPALSGLVAAFTFAAAFGSLAATLLGHGGFLRPTPFLLVVAAGLLATLPASRRSPAPRAAEIADDEAPPSLPSPPPSSLVDRLGAIVAIATVAAMGLGFAAEAVHRFFRPLHGGPDDLSYHLSAIAVWRHWGDLRMLKFSMGDWGTAFYPILPELWGWILLTPFGDSDVAARWSALPWAIGSLVALAAIARRLGLGWQSTVLAAALYGVVHRVAVLAFAAGNDHVTAFCTLAALDAALACAERPRMGRFAYLGTALGLLVASKYLGIYNAITVATVFAVAWAVRQRRARTRWLPSAAILLATLVLSGGYTYLRNWVATGNPVYPQPVTVAGHEVFAGRAELSLGSRRGGEQSRIDLVDFLAGPDNAFAPFFPYTLLPAALLAPLLALARRRWLDAAVLALPAAFFLEFLHLTWDHRDVRYFLAGIALAAVAFAWLGERLGRAGGWIRVVLLSVVLYRYVRWLGIQGEWELTTALLLLACVAVGWRTWPRWGTGARAAVPAAMGAVLVAAALTLGCGVARYQRAKLTAMPAAVALESMVGERGATVGYVGLNQPYLFFGSRLQNLVHVVPRSWNLRAEYYRWGGNPDRPYPPGSYRRWLTVMDTLGVRYVVVVRSPWERPERLWMANHTERFRRRWFDEQMEVWELLPAHAARTSDAERPVR